MASNKERYFDYLDNLRESGATNMYGAVPYLMEDFAPMEQSTAIAILSEWMQTFSERQLLKKGKGV